ncbi:hypothetical protein TNCV_3287481 [Trichonephila clavipes]|nr:hypothetical protein TNCV_3287481 [Trichonephila clavipes]
MVAKLIAHIWRYIAKFGAKKLSRQIVANLALAAILASLPFKPMLKHGGPCNAVEMILQLGKVLCVESGCGTTACHLPWLMSCGFVSYRVFIFSVTQIDPFSRQIVYIFKTCLEILHVLTQAMKVYPEEATKQQVTRRRRSRPLKHLGCGDIR